MSCYLKFLKRWSIFKGQALRKTALFLLWAALAVIFVNAKALAEVENVSLKWGELKSVISDRTIETVLLDGIALKGRVMTVTADSVQLEIEETSDQVKYPKGRARVPRESLSTLQFTEVRGSWRAIGTAVGAGAGAAAGIPIYSYMRNEAAEEKGAAVVAALAGGSAAIGFLAGRNADKRTVVVSIVPD